MSHACKRHDTEQVRAALKLIEHYSPFAIRTIAEHLNYLAHTVREYEKVGREIEKIVSCQALTIDTLRECESNIKYLDWFKDQRGVDEHLGIGQMVSHMGIRAFIPITEQLRNGRKQAILDGKYKP